jgi:hypothetical protein
MMKNSSCFLAVCIVFMMLSGIAEATRNMWEIRHITAEVLQMREYVEPYVIKNYKAPDEVEQLRKIDLKIQVLTGGLDAGMVIETSAVRRSGDFKDPETALKIGDVIRCDVDYICHLQSCFYSLEGIEVVK